MVVEKKYKCDLAISGEGWATGTIMLTKKEYEIVKKVTDYRNWDNPDIGLWCGNFMIECKELDKNEVINV